LISALAAILALAGAAPDAKPIPQATAKLAPAPGESCSIHRPSTQPGVYGPQDFPALKPLSLTARTSLPQLPAPDGVVISCNRPSLTFGPEDFRIITEYGLPFVILSGGRTAAFELNEGTLRIRMIVGDLSQAEADTMKAMIAATEQRIQAQAKMSPSSRPAAQRPR